MKTSALTDELKQMNAYWRLLVGLVNEGLGIVNDERRSPEARLERLREKVEFARQFTRELPQSVRAELDADPAVQAVLADIARRHDHAHEAGGATYFVMGDDGETHELVDGPESGMQPLSEEEIRALLQADGDA